MTSYVLTATSTPSTPARLLGVDSSNNPCAVSPPPTSVGIDVIDFDFTSATDVSTATFVKYWRVPYSGFLSDWSLIGDVSGSATVEIWKKAGAVPTVADKITASAPPSLVSQQYVNSATFTGWTGYFAAGDVFAFVVTSMTTIRKLHFQLTVTRN